MPEEEDFNCFLNPNEKVYRAILNQPKYWEDDGSMKEKLYEDSLNSERNTKNKKLKTFEEINPLARTIWCAIALIGTVVSFIIAALMFPANKNTQVNFSVVSLMANDTEKPTNEINITPIVGLNGNVGFGFSNNPSKEIVKVYSMVAVQNSTGTAKCFELDLGLFSLLSKGDVITLDQKKSISGDISYSYNGQTLKVLADSTGIKTTAKSSVQ